MRGPTSDTKIEFADLDKSFRADDTYTKQLSRFQTIHVDQTIQYVDTDFQLQDGYNTLLELIEAPPPDSVLLRQEGFEKVTYGDLRKFIETEGDLRRFGVRKNDAIAYITAPGAVGAVSFLSCGVQTCVCPMDRRANKQEIFDACNQLLVKFYIYFKGSLDNVNLNACTLDELTEVCDTLGITIIEATLDKGGKAGFYTFEPGDEDVDNAEPLRTEPEDVICMLRTSGSTGPPKAVPLHQSGIVQNGLALAEILELKSTDINLNVMPLFHIGGLSCCVLASMTKGASLICMEGFNEQDFIGILAYEEDAPTWYHAVPAVHKAILQHCNGLAPEHRLRFIRSGAASLKHEAAVELSELFGVPVIPTYSMSEQMPIVQVPADYRLEKENSVGVPNACSLLIIDKEWDTVDWETGVKEPCPHGKVGEVCISGPTVMNGYLNNETANRKSFFTWNNKEWFTTGDLGIIDEEGYLLLKGRKKNMIKKNGEQVSPFEVEEAVEAFAEIKTALAFPVPDEALGEGVGVMLILNDGHLVLDELAFYRSIRARCADKLMAFKVPDYIYKCKDRDLPKTTTKKCKRAELYKVVESMKLRSLNEIRQLSPAGSGIMWFCSAYFVFMHAGSSAGSWGSDKLYFADATNMRYFPFHLNLFIMMGGLGMVAPMRGRTIKNKRKFYCNTVLSLYPLYIFSFALAIIQWVMHCTPSNYVDEFTVYPETRCMAPAANLPYGATFILTVVSYMLGLQAWPTYYVTWFMQPYTWFISVYFFCIMLTPYINNFFVRNKHQMGRILLGVFALQAAVFGITYTYFAIDDQTVFVDFPGEDEPVELGSEGRIMWTLFAFIFPPFHVPTFMTGIALYFVFITSRGNAKIWGLITDSITLFVIGCLLMFWFELDTLGFMSGTRDYGRLRSILVWQLLLPVLATWIYGLCVGYGLTAKLATTNVMMLLSSTCYGTFLFHDTVINLWLLCTRQEQFSGARHYYFFSTEPAQVAVWEYCIIAMLSTLAGYAANEYLLPLLWPTSLQIMEYLFGIQRSTTNSRDFANKVLEIFQDITGDDGLELDTRIKETSIVTSSLHRSNVWNKLKEAFPDVDLDYTEYVHSEHLDDLVEYVRSLYQDKIQKEEARPSFAGNHSKIFKAAILNDIYAGKLARSLDERRRSASQRSATPNRAPTLRDRGIMQSMESMSFALYTEAERVKDWNVNQVHHWWDNELPKGCQDYIFLVHEFEMDGSDLIGLDMESLQQYGMKKLAAKKVISKVRALYRADELEQLQNISQLDKNTFANSFSHSRPREFLSQPRENPSIDMPRGMTTFGYHNADVEISDELDMHEKVPTLSVDNQYDLPKRPRNKAVQTKRTKSQTVSFDKTPSPHYYNKDSPPKVRSALLFKTSSTGKNDTPV